MKGQDIAYAAAGFAVVYLVSKLFTDSEDDKAAERFVGLWELSDPDPLMRGLREGKVTAKQLAALAANVDVAARIGRAVAQLQNAPGTFNDDEAAAASAVMFGNYPEQLAFGSTFKRVTGKTALAYLVDFLGDTDSRAMIVRHIEGLRMQKRK